MNPLHALLSLLGQHQQSQGQMPHGILPMSQVRQPMQAQGHNQRPLQVAPSNANGFKDPNLGVSFHQPQARYNVQAQGGQFNPGFTPLQNSGHGPGGTPQIKAFNSPQDNVYNYQQ